MKEYALYKTENSKNFKELLQNCPAYYNGRPLFREKENGGIKDTSCEQFAEMVQRLGAAFLKLGLLGGKIAVMGETSAKWIATYFATVCGASVIVPVDKELPEDEMAYILNNSEAAALIYAPSLEAEVRSIQPKAPGVKYFIGMAAPEENETWLSFDALVQGSSSAEIDAYNAIEVDAAALSTILYTSGTTGKSKGVMLCQKNILCAALGGLQMFEVGKVSMSILPIHHVFEMTHGIVEMMANGTTICINDSLRYFMQNLQLFQPEAMFVVPAFVEMIYKKIWANAQATGQEEQLKALIAKSNELLEQGIDKRDEFFQFIKDALGGNFRMMLCAGAPLDPFYVKGFREIGILLLQGFGLTETSPLVTANRNHYVVDASTGAAIQNCEVKIAEPNEKGEGEICVRGDNVMLGYYKDDIATAEVMIDGWFHTGDMGYVDEAGLLYVTGRKKNVIILSNGKNIYPEEMEGYYMHIPYVKEIVVYAAKNDGSNVSLCAEIFVEETFSEKYSKEQILEELNKDVAQINKKLPGYKQVHHLKLRDTMFEKTTKKSIKRHTVNQSS